MTAIVRKPGCRAMMRTSESGHSCGGSEVRIIVAASPSRGLLNQSHNGNNKLPVSFRFRSSQTRLPRNDANFGIRTLAAFHVSSTAAPNSMAKNSSSITAPPPARSQAICSACSMRTN